VLWQKPSTQVSPPVQTLVQLPQWRGDVSVLTQRSPQQESPFSQPLVVQPEGDWHTPPMHVSPFGQSFSQPPQKLGFVTSSTHPPLQQLRPPLHARPPPHAGTHSVSMQMSFAGHWLVVRQPTQSPVPMSQMGLLAGHWLFEVQPPGRGWQVWVVGLQASPTGQVSGSVRHATHTPCGNSQNGVAGVPSHCWLVVQPVGPSVWPS